MELSILHLLFAAHAHISRNKTKQQWVSNSKHPLLLHMLFTMTLQSSSTLSPRTSGAVFKTDTDRGKNEVPTYFILQKLFQLKGYLFMTSVLLIQHLWVTIGSHLLNSNGISTQSVWKVSSHLFHGIYTFRGSTIASSDFSYIIKKYFTAWDNFHSLRKA